MIAIQLPAPQHSNLRSDAAGQRVAEAIDETDRHPLRHAAMAAIDAASMHTSELWAAAGMHL